MPDLPRDPNDEIPLLSDFQKPVVPQPPKRPAPQPEAPRETPLAGARAEGLDAAEKRIAEEAQAAEKQKKPLEKYEERLKEVGVTKEEAAVIVDSVLTHGFYEEDIPITKRFKVRFRTRQYADTLRLNNFLEQTRPAYQAHYQEAVFNFSLASSLREYGAQSFEHPKKDTTEKGADALFNARLTFVQGLPDAMVRLLYEKLGRWDDKIRVCLEEGAIENF